MIKAAWHQQVTKARQGFRVKSSQRMSFTRGLGGGQRFYVVEALL